MRSVSRRYITGVAASSSGFLNSSNEGFYQIMSNVASQQEWQAPQLVSSASRCHTSTKHSQRTPGLSWPGCAKSAAGVVSFCQIM